MSESGRQYNLSRCSETDIRAMVAALNLMRKNAANDVTLQAVDSASSKLNGGVCSLNEQEFQVAFNALITISKSLANGNLKGEANAKALSAAMTGAAVTLMSLR